MFSQSVDYALRAIVFLAMNPSRLVTTEEIAKTTLVPAPYLAKIIQSLNKARLVHSQRGVNGGTRLARPAADITVLSVVNAVEPLQRIDYCPLGLKSHGVNLCAMHKRLDSAIAMVEDALGNSTIEDLLTHPTSSVPMYPNAPNGNSD